MSHGWDTRTVIETAVPHRWARRIQREPQNFAAARNVLNVIFICYKTFFLNKTYNDSDTSSNVPSREIIRV